MSTVIGLAAMRPEETLRPLERSKVEGRAGKDRLTTGAFCPSMSMVLGHVGDIGETA
jgi:hypothetical protein